MKLNFTKHHIAQKRNKITSHAKIKLFNKNKGEIKIQTNIIQHVHDANITFQKPKMLKHSPITPNLKEHFITINQGSVVNMKR